MSAFAFSSRPKRYSPSFKREALHQLAAGRTHQKVAQLMGVSPQTLQRWQQEAQKNRPQKAANESKSGAHRNRFSVAFKQKAVDLLETGQSITQIAHVVGVSARTLYSWKYQLEGVKLRAEWELTGKADLHSDVVRKAALRLIRYGQQAEQVSSLLDIPLDLIKTWNDQPTTKPMRVKGTGFAKGRGERYDEEFKNRALTKLENGMSMAKVAKLTGVTTATLHRWKKEAKAFQEDLPPVQELRWLRRQLQQAEQERNILKEALAILLSTAPGAATESVSP